MIEVLQKWWNLQKSRCWGAWILRDGCGGLPKDDKQEQVKNELFPSSWFIPLHFAADLLQSSTSERFVGLFSDIRLCPQTLPGHWKASLVDWHDVSVLELHLSTLTICSLNSILNWFKYYVTVFTSKPSFPLEANSYYATAVGINEMAEASNYIGLKTSAGLPQG